MGLKEKKRDQKIHFLQSSLVVMSFVMCSGRSIEVDFVECMALIRNTLFTNASEKIGKLSVAVCVHFADDIGI